MIKNKESKLIKKECSHVKGSTRNGCTEDEKSQICICPDCHEHHIIPIKRKKI